MARARNIKPGFYKNEDLAECSIWARYIFPGLWTLADREGRLEDRPKRIKAELLPFDGTDVEPLLSELHGRGFILRYRNADGNFIQILKFKTHQSPHYSEKASVIKPPILPESNGDDGAITPRKPPEDSGGGGVIKRGSQPPESLVLNPDSPNPDSRLSDSPNPDTGKERTALAKKRSPPAIALGFGDFYAHYPRKAGKPKAEKAWRALDPDADLCVTIMAALEEHKQSRQWSDPNFIPHPATWLNQRRFDDSVPRETDSIEEGNRRAAAAFVAGDSAIDS